MVGGVRRADKKVSLLIKAFIVKFLQEHVT